MSVSIYGGDLASQFDLAQTIHSRADDNEMRLT